jgi:hypothetical protein
MFEPGELNRSVSVGVALKDRGIESALEKAERVKASYIEACLSAIKSFPSGCLLTSEDVRERAGDPPAEVNHSVMAGILRKAASQNLLYVTNETRTAKRSSIHAKRLSCWRRL